VPIDLSCINLTLIERLSELFSGLELGLIVDVKDKISSRLWMFKLQSLFFKDGKTVDFLERCTGCNSIYSSTSDPLLECQVQFQDINIHGKIIRKHTSDPNFDVNRWIAKLLKELKSWEIVYWKVWGHLNHLKCKVCTNWFSLVNYDACCQHPEINTPSENGLCRSCQKSFYSFSPFDLNLVLIF
jgi:hypothetical protein